MNNEPDPSTTLTVYVLAGIATPLLPSCMCFFLLAAASFSSDPLIRILVLTIVTAGMGASIGWLAYRRQHALEATILTALLAPPIGYFISMLATEFIEQQLAHWGWIRYL